MRDLAQQLPGNRGNSRIKKIIRLTVVLVVVGTILFYAKSKLIGGTGGGSSIVLREAPRGLKPVSDEGAEKVTDKGVNLVTQRASFADLKFGGEAQATATRSFGGGTYILSVNATLPDPKNTYYQVWLVGGGNIIPIDYMRGLGNSWSLNLRSQDKYSQYKGIWITLERTKDELPEEHVLDGTF